MPLAERWDLGKGRPPATGARWKSGTFAEGSHCGVRTGARTPGLRGSEWAREWGGWGVKAGSPSQLLDVGPLRSLLPFSVP